MNQDNLVLHPKVIEQLKIDIDHLMGEKAFDKALPILRHLLEHKENTYELNRDTLTCFVQLNLFEEALQLCELLLQNTQSPYYYQYLDYYIIALHEAGKFVELLEVIELETKKGIPKEYRHKLNEFKILALQMIQWNEEDLLKQLYDAVKENNAQQQYYIIQKWQRLKLGRQDYFYNMLKSHTIHPVIKTMIFTMLQEWNVDQNVIVTKFNKTSAFSPAATIKMEHVSCYKRTLTFLEKVEQKNPSLYILAKELLDHYMYVQYPFSIGEKSANELAETITIITEGNLGLIEDRPGETIVQELLLCQQLYEELIVI